jgi:hypothetical protein
MAEKYQTYIGIDVQAVQKPYFYSAMNSNLEVIACGHGRLPDVTAYLAGQTSALVAVNGPVCLPHDSVQIGLFEGGEDGSQPVTRAGDRELEDRGFHDLAVQDHMKKTPLWVERSLELAESLARLEYSQKGGQKKYFETQSDAAYWLATGAMPYESRSLEGRLQRQLLLWEFGMAVKDPMNFLEEFTRFRLRTSQVPMDQILPGHELRAMIAASTAWLLDNHPERVEHFGVDTAGEIILPREFNRKQN